MSSFLPLFVHFANILDLDAILLEQLLDGLSSRLIVQVTNKQGYHFCTYTHTPKKNHLAEYT